jgi:hypothetical protein
MNHPIAEVSRELAASQARLDAIAAGSRLAGTLSRFVRRLDKGLTRPPRVLLIGEFNAGKSTLANALIGREVLPTSILANTRVPLIVHFSERPALVLECREHQRHNLDEAALRLLSTEAGCVLHVGLPVEDLRTFELIDTPGLASGIAHADEMLLDACRRAHIAIWCTRAAQAWKASEQAVWRSLPRRLHRNGILAVTGSDLVNGEREREKLDGRLQTEASDCFFGRVILAAADADELRRAPHSDDYAQRWQACGGHALDVMIRTLLAQVMDARQLSARRAIARTTERLVGNREPIAEAVAAEGSSAVAA